MLNERLRKHPGLNLHWGESSGPAVTGTFYSTEEEALKAGVEYPVYIAEGTPFEVEGKKYVHSDKARLGRPLEIINGLPLIRALDLPDPDR